MPPLISSPRISVLMAVHNGTRLLAHAIESILAQTDADFELIIVDDGSTDATPQLLATFAQRDARIRLITQPNAGLTISLNRAWDMAHGELIARMDADDISLPERLARQSAFLQAQPTIAACGTWVQTINNQDKLGAIWQYPTAPEQIRYELLFRNVLAHPTVMLRKNVFDAAGLRYDPTYQRAQDYDLWLRAADKLALANLPDVLLHYRVSPEQISQQHQSAQLLAAAQIYTRRLQQMGLTPSPEELALHQRLFTGDMVCDTDILQPMGAWLAKIGQANQHSQAYPPDDFTQFLAKKWLHFCRKCAPLGLAAWRMFRSSPLHQQITNAQQVKLFTRCILRQH